MASNRPSGIQSQESSASRSFLGMRQQQFGMLNEMQRRGREHHQRASGIQQDPPRQGKVEKLRREVALHKEGSMGSYEGDWESESRSFLTNASRLISGEGSDITLGGGSSFFNSRGSFIGDWESSESGEGPTRSEIERGFRDFIREQRPEVYNRLREAGIYSGSGSEVSEEHIYDEIGKTIPPNRRPKSSQHTNTLKEDIISGIKSALGIHDPAPYYVPNKINRDTGRLGAINRIPQNKTWSIAELEYYNRKGYVDYKVKNIDNKTLPKSFNPSLPVLGLERRPPTTTYNKPGLFAPVERIVQPSKVPISYLVA